MKMKSKKLNRQCPECRNEMSLDGGNSLNYEPPYIYCPCGYSEEPKEEDFLSLDFDKVLDTYTEIYEKADGDLQVKLRAGNRTFNVNSCDRNKEHAKWMQRMLAKAIYEIIEDARDV